MQRWQLAGSAPEIYAEHLVPAIFGPWVPLVVGAAHLEEGQSVLDVACGTGAIAVAAAQRVGATGSVTGLDNNPGMLAVAAARSKGTGVRWCESDAQALPFPDDSFHAVICQLGLQYFPDRPSAVREMARVLRPGGRVVVMVWRDVDHSPGFAALVAALEENVGKEAAAVMRAPFALGDDPGPLVAVLEDAGLVDVTVETLTGMVRFDSTEAFVRYQSAGSPLAAHVDRHDHALLARLDAAVAGALGAATAGEPVGFPIEAHLARARKNAAGA